MSKSKHSHNSHAPAPYINPHRPCVELNLSSSLSETTNTPVTPTITTGTPYVKVPVVLAETTVHIDMDSTINFPDPVLEIKDIKKNLKVTQCRLLLPTNRLFIRGFVRKTILYTTPCKGSRNCLSSEIRSLTVDVPFSTVTPITFINRPVFNAGTATTEFDYFTSSSLPWGCEDDKLLSGDFCKFNQVSTETFNEPTFCELISSRFVELDEAIGRKMGCVTNECGEDIEAPFEEGTFKSIEEKMVVELTLKVLQKQQIRVSSNSSSGDCDE
ncbi:hypothetical protein JOD45_001317 [Scopulibacillus daqui]|uniref:DUF7852 domain-containing protein n=1 Tax=Scopulibacillus daqui TaxID=1469162 RepID=A0ABS2PYH7_9BACL|nr:SPOCS domain-containing protein [Scopulibacillus daqui]MBM7645106.1 hypothetical protein [Scopulibacillus daqui]